MGRLIIPFSFLVANESRVTLLKRERKRLIKIIFKEVSDWMTNAENVSPVLTYLTYPTGLGFCLYCLFCPR